MKEDIRTWWPYIFFFIILDLQKKTQATMDLLISDCEYFVSHIAQNKYLDKASQQPESKGL